MINEYQILDVTSPGYEEITKILLIYCITLFFLTALHPYYIPLISYLKSLFIALEKYLSYCQSKKAYKANYW